MIKKKAMQLVKALRSGSYTQGRGLLVDNEDNFCCLGVACNISKAPLEWEQKRIEEEDVWAMDGCSVELPLPIQKEFGLHTPLGNRIDQEFINIEGETYSGLAVANDNGANFEQIADYIEKNWEHL